MPQVIGQDHNAAEQRKQAKNGQAQSEVPLIPRDVERGWWRERCRAPGT
jgi:hypothetical protein